MNTNIKAAILGVNAFSRITEVLIRQLYNKYVEVTQSGDGMDVVAYIQKNGAEIKDWEDDIPVLSFCEVKKMMDEGKLEVVILPRPNFDAQRTLFSLRANDIPLEYLYIVPDSMFGKEDYAIEDADNLFVPYFEDSYLPYLEYHVEDACNMNCKACEHYSALVNGSVRMDFEEFSKDISRLKTLINEIGMIRILGGEPLMNSELPKYIRLTREMYPNSDIRVVTNALLIKSISDEVFVTMKECFVHFDISLYKPVVGKIKDITDYIVSKGVQFTCTEPIDEFSIKQNLTGDSDMIAQFNNCFQSECHNIYRGQIAACFLPFVTHYFNEAFGKDIPENGGIDLYEESLTTRELKERLSKPLERCRYCSQPVMIPWDQASKTPILSDWVME